MEYVHNLILLSYLKQGNTEICRQMSGTRRYYPRWSNRHRKTHLLCTHLSVYISHIDNHPTINIPKELKKEEESNGGCYIISHGLGSERDIQQNLEKNANWLGELCNGNEGGEQV